MTGSPSRFRASLSGPARIVVTAAGLILFWKIAVVASGLPAFLLPPPEAVLAVLIERFDLIMADAAVTGLEIVLGLLVGTLFGAVAATAVTVSRPARRWVFPLLVASQAIPVFTLAPLLMLWFGFGLGPKIAMAALIVFFPVTAAFHDGLRRTDPGLLDLARTMGGGRLRTLLHIRLPAALPAFASGLRTAAATAPIGAVVGEWVGASAGLGRLMLHANARAQTDLMFAALLVLAVMALALYAAVDRGLRRAMPWQSDTLA